jgi:hypothetical protein
MDGRNHLHTMCLKSGRIYWKIRGGRSMEGFTGKSAEAVPRKDSGSATSTISKNCYFSGLMLHFGKNGAQALALWRSGYSIRLEEDSGSNLAGV